MKIARHFAERITALRYEDLPPEAVYWSKVAVMDTLGVMLADGAAQMRSRPLLLLMPAAVLVALVYACNRLGDALRERHGV
jgi:2-methylcitrate dehydratase PrpD